MDSKTITPIRIGILGYGKMGKAVEAIALDQGDQIMWVADSNASGYLKQQDFNQVDVVIEFSQPDAALSNVLRALDAGTTVVSGTTGWLESIPMAVKAAQNNNVGFLYASNFSIGVNLFFALNSYASKLMAGIEGYAPSLSETHHIHKKDKPSGTAITLANSIIDQSGGAWSRWQLDLAVATNQSIPIASIREDEVPGTHVVTWHGKTDKIQLIHEAQSRSGFASGALKAAHWIRGKKGIFSMADVLGIPELTK
jgi:4-hydroxy-tetrahydrodipicolinate reductase